MDIIVTLQLKFESISDDLEKLEVKVAAQENQTKKIKFETITTKKSLVEEATHVQNLENKLDETGQQEREIDRTTKRLETEIECIEEANAQLPKLLVKLYENFAELSSKKIKNFASYCQTAISSKFWTEETHDLNKSIIKLKQQLNASEIYRTQSQKGMESRLATQLQEEELNLAYCNSCIEALRQKNRELIELKDSAPLPNNSETRRFETQQESQMNNPNSNQTNYNGGTVTHTLKRTVTEEYIAYDSVALATENDYDASTPSVNNTSRPPQYRSEPSQHVYSAGYNSDWRHAHDNYRRDDDCFANSVYAFEDPAEKKNDTVVGQSASLPSYTPQYRQNSPRTSTHTRPENEWFRDHKRRHMPAANNVHQAHLFTTAAELANEVIDID